MKEITVNRNTLDGYKSLAYFLDKLIHEDYIDALELDIPELEKDLETLYSKIDKYESEIPEITPKLKVGNILKTSYDGYITYYKINRIYVDSEGYQMTDLESVSMSKNGLSYRENSSCEISREFSDDLEENYTEVSESEWSEVMKLVQNLETTWNDKKEN